MMLRGAAIACILGLSQAYQAPLQPQIQPSWMELDEHIGNMFPRIEQPIPLIGEEASVEAGRQQQQKQKMKQPLDVNSRSTLAELSRTVQELLRKTEAPISQQSALVERASASSKTKGPKGLEEDGEEEEEKGEVSEASEDEASEGEAESAAKPADESKEDTEEDDEEAKDDDREKEAEEEEERFKEEEEEQSPAASTEASSEDKPIQNPGALLRDLDNLYKRIHGDKALKDTLDKMSSGEHTGTEVTPESVAHLASLSKKMKAIEDLTSKLGDGNAAASAADDDDEEEVGDEEATQGGNGSLSALLDHTEQLVAAVQKLQTRLGGDEGDHSARVAKLASAKIEAIGEVVQEALDLATV